MTNVQTNNTPATNKGPIAQTALENDEVLDLSDDGTETPQEFDFWNDMQIEGEESPALSEFLNREATFMLGNLYGERDRRNTQDGDWKAKTLPWSVWIEGQDKGVNGNKEEWGFSRHPKNKRKAGSSVVFAEAIDGSRKDSAISTMYAVALDVDSGAALDDVIEKLIELELFALVYTSHSHGKSVLELKHDDIVRKLKLDAEPDRAQVMEYLRAHHKDRYDESFIEQIEVVDARKQTADGLRTIVRTPALDKFRVIFPLAEPVELARLGNTWGESKTVWEDKVCGVAVNMLGINFDASSCDVNRLFFLPRHPPGNEEWYSCLVQGNPLRFEDIEPFPKSKYVKDRGANDNAFTAGTEGDDFERETFETPSGMILNRWHHKHKERWLAADAIEDYCPDKIRVAGGERVGTVHLECPFEAEHSTEGGTATMAMNPDASDSGYWTIFCRHDSCNGRDKLEFVQEMIEQGWLPESVLTDPQYLLPAPDDELEDDYSTAHAEGPITELGDDIEVKAVLDAAGIDRNSSEDDIRVFVRRCWNGNADRTARGRVAEAIAGRTPLNKVEAKKLFTELDEEAKAEDGARAKRKAEREYEKRRNSERDPYIPLEDETPESIEESAEKAPLPVGFFVRDNWIWKTNFADPDKPSQVCKVFKVAGISYVEGGTDIEVEIRFEHRSAERVGIVSRKFLLGDAYRDSNALVAKMVGDGLVINPVGGTSKEDGPNAIVDLIRLLRAIETDREALIVSKPGFTADKKAWISTTGEVVGDDPTEYVLDPAKRVKRHEKGGAHAGWKDNVSSAVSQPNGDIILAGLATGFAGTFLDYIDYPNSLIVAFEGDSSKGKTTAQGYGVSVHTTPGKGGLMVKADATATASENVAERSNGAVMALDDDGTARIDPAEKQRLALQWSEGQGRIRGTRDAGIQDIKTWTTCFTMSGEVGFTASLEAAKIKDVTVNVRAGAVARIIAISMQDAVDLNTVENGAAVIANYDAMVRNPENFGWAGPMFAKVLMDMGVDAAKERHEEVVARLVAARLVAARAYSSTEMRIVRAMAVLIASLEIAEEHEIIDKVDAFDMMEGLMLKSIEQRSGHLNVATQTVETVRAAIKRMCQKGRIVDVFDADAETHPQGFVGYFGYLDAAGREDAKKTAANIPAQRVYYLPVNRLHELGYSGDAVNLAKLIETKGGLIRPADGSKYTHRHLPAEGSEKHIRVLGSFVHGEEEEAE